MMFDFLTNTMNAANTSNIFAKLFPNFADFNFFNFVKKFYIINTFLYFSV